MKNVAKKLIVMLLAFLMAIVPMISIGGCSKKDKSPPETVEEAVEEYEIEETEEDLEF